MFGFKGMEIYERRVTSMKKLLAMVLALVMTLSLAIIDAIDNKVITDTEIVAVISNNKNAFALERAKKVGIL